jgi:putative aldouronate transport system permease protein
MSRLVSKPQMVFRFFNYIFLITVGLICLTPFVNLLAISFSSSAPVAAGRVLFLPINFTVESYKFAIMDGKFFPAFFISVERVILGVSVNLIFMIFAAYPLSKSKEGFSWRNAYMFYFVVTMFISGGLIPTYLVVVKAGLLDSIWSLIITCALPVGTMVILMNFIRRMPPEIEEAAMIDGAGIFSRLIKVILPLLKPAIATVALFCIVGHWNDWFGGIIYMRNPNRYPLQTYLQTMLQDIESLMRLSDTDYVYLLAMLNARTGRAAQLFLGALPMLLIYPFLQRYFTKGLVIGAVKG